MDFTSLVTIVGIIILLAALGWLKPIRQVAAGIGTKIERADEVADMAVDEWHTEAIVNHSKKMTKLYAKAEAIGTVKTKADILELVKRKAQAEE